MNEAQAISLARKHGGETGTDNGLVYIDIYPDELAAMLTDNRAQVIEELAAKTGMGDVMQLVTAYANERVLAVHGRATRENVFAADDAVREALAVMQAKLEQAQADAARLRAALQLTLDAHGIMLLSNPPQEAWKAWGVEAKARAALAAMKEQGRAIALSTGGLESDISKSSAIVRTSHLRLTRIGLNTSRKLGLKGIEMNDRELLELAAKAAGMDKEFFATEEDGSISSHETLGLYLAWGKGFWNPLTDDGDALRLAVQLGLDVCIDTPQEPEPHTQAIGFADSGPDTIDAIEYHGDPYAATRRAIVRAAAEIGKQMKGQAT
jgi:hypothetical protein